MLMCKSANRVVRDVRVGVMSTGELSFMMICLDWGILGDSRGGHAGTCLTSRVSGRTRTCCLRRRESGGAFFSVSSEHARVEIALLRRLRQGVVLSKKIQRAWSTRWTTIVICTSQRSSLTASDLIDSQPLLTSLMSVRPQRCRYVLQHAQELASRGRTAAPNRELQSIRQRADVSRRPYFGAGALGGRHCTDVLHDSSGYQRRRWFACIRTV